MHWWDVTADLQDAAGVGELGTPASIVVRLSADTFNTTFTEHQMRASPSGSRGMQMYWEVLISLVWERERFNQILPWGTCNSEYVS